jgi:Dna[CI] antecedent DciA-like protein
MPRRQKKGARTTPVPAGALVAQVLARAGIAAAVREHRLVTEWETVVGPRIAARAWPDGLNRGVLYVRVVNSAWLHELGFLKEAIVAQANRTAGDPPLVREVRLHLGARRGPADDLVAELAAARRKPRPAPRPRTPLAAAAAARIERETEKVADGELREAIRAAWRKLDSR